MLEQVTSFVGGVGNSGILVIIGIFVGSLLIVYGFFGGLIAQNPVGRRYHNGKNVTRKTAFEAGLLSNADVDPKGFMKALMPQNREKRTLIRRQLLNAGFIGDNAVAKFYAMRIAMALGLPAIYLCILVLRQATLLPLPEALGEMLDGQSRMVTYYILTALLLFGYIMPALWLRSKVDERQLEISDTISG